MNNKSIVFGIIILFLLSNSISYVSSCNTSINKTIYVDDDGGADYTRIQDAIDNASDGDTVFVYSGFYMEKIIINKSLDIIGENRDTTIIELKNKIDEEDTVYIYSNYVNLSGFKIQNSPRCGIFLASSFVNIKDNILINNTHSIHFYLTNSQVKISNNQISNNYCGIYLVSCSNDNISGNNISNNDFGIRVSFSSNNSIYNNNIQSNNKYGLILHQRSMNNKIMRNNFIDNTKNAYFILFSHKNDWNENYWGISDIDEYRIVGCFGLIFPIFFNFDWNPSNEPYDI